MSNGESAGRARLIAELRDHAEGYEREARALDNEFPEPDAFCKARGGDSARQVAKLMREAAEALAGLLRENALLKNRIEELSGLIALAGQEEAPQQKDGEEEDHARGGSVPGTEHGDLPRLATGDS